MADAATNQEQITQWNEKSGPKWVAMQERLDAQLEQFTRVILERVSLRPGERVLDIGCGCGASTFAAAVQVRPGGTCLGADISRPMLQRARERAVELGARDVEFVEADAQTFAFAPSSFDAVISRFGVMFFADPVAAFANIRRALKPGGRLCFICWRPMMENPWVLIPLGAASQHLELPPPPAPAAPGPFAFADAERLHGILADAGFTNARIDRHDAPMSVGESGDIDTSADFLMDVGPVSALLAGKGDELRVAVRTSIREALRPYLTASGVQLGSAAWMVAAQNP